MTLTGNLLSSACVGGAATYSTTVTCPAGTTDCATLTGLAPGIWKHQVSTGAQNQATKSVLVADDPNGIANLVSWTVFATVFSVDRTDDVTTNPTPLCPSVLGSPTCTLRQALLGGAIAPPPLLIQFDPAVFPAGQETAVQLAQSGSLRMAGQGMTVDGTDPNGDPSFPGDPRNRRVLLPSSGATLVFSNQGANLIGLSLQRPALVNGATPGDIVRFDGTLGLADQNLIAHCRIYGGAGALTLKSSAHDCIAGVGGAGHDWSRANIVRDTEITACPDKAVKTTSLAYIAVQDSWVHHNIGGGLQATLSGNLEADRNIIELNGYNASAQVFLDANGIAANGASATTPNSPSVIQTNGNLFRYNSSRGISVQELSQATITNDFTCGASNSATNGQNGIAIFNSTASSAHAVVRGVASVYNGRNGATITNQSTGDFGQSGDDGNNAFAQNAANANLRRHNYDNSNTQTTASASGNQWQHCYADPANPMASCDGPLNLDVSGSVITDIPQAHRSAALTLPMTIQTVEPSKPLAGELVHISGHGFNAIDGYPAGGNCTDSIALNNSCSPIVGTCVQYEAAPGQWIDLPVQAVTPNHIVVQAPATTLCVAPLTLRVQRLDYAGNVVTATALVCTNS